MTKGIRFWAHFLTSFKQKVVRGEEGGVGAEEDTLLCPPPLPSAASGQYGDLLLYVHIPSVSHCE